MDEQRGSAGDGMIWANLLHLSYNMWCDWDMPGIQSPYYVGRPHLRFEEQFWDELIDAMAEGGLNMVVIDLGDGVRYESHPEIAVEGAWPVDRLVQEVKRLRQRGLEPIPKLNFSAAHDHWLGRYSRMVSTPEYYAVAGDLIAEVAEIFGRPRLFHLGMDEEQAKHQQKFEYCVVRQHGLWWHDLRFLVEQVESRGMRAWIWSDYAWEHPALFYENMPKSILQSNWYYGEQFTPDTPWLKEYIELEKAGFDQVPTVSNWRTPQSIADSVDFCRRHIDPQRLKGFVLTPWRPTLAETRPRHMDAIEHFAAAIAAWRKG